jgi:hypothetical protein
VTLGVGSVLSEPLQVSHQDARFDNGLSMLDALDVTLISMLAHRGNDDDVVGARHLELEVGVVGDCHELSITWPP